MSPSPHKRSESPQSQPPPQPILRQSEMYRELYNSLSIQTESPHLSSQSQQVCQTPTDEEESQATVTLSSIRRAIVAWDSDCALCHVIGLRPVERRHQLQDCPRRGAAQIRGQIQEVSEYFEPRSAPHSCGSCLLPKAICHRYREVKGNWQGSGTQSCQFSPVVIPVGLAVIMSINRSTKMLRNMVVLPEMEENGVRIENKDEVIGWLMQERTWGGITSTNITWIFHRLHGERAESGVEDEDESEEERGWVVRGTYKRRRSSTDSQETRLEARKRMKISINEMLYCQFHCPGCPIGEHDL